MMSLRDSKEKWWWQAPGCEQRAADKWELVSLLCLSAIPSDTRVWRAGWTDWVPACRVEELAEAVGEDTTETVRSTHDTDSMVHPEVREQLPPTADSERDVATLRMRLPLSSEAFRSQSGRGAGTQSADVSPASERECTSLESCASTATALPVRDSQRQLSERVLGWFATAAGGALLTLSLAGAGVAFWVEADAAPASEAAAVRELSGPAESVSSTPMPIPCRIGAHARRIYRAVEPSVPLVTSSVSDDRILVGFAASSRVAVGLSLELVSLQPKQELVESGREPVAGVVPHAAGYFTTRGGGPLREPRAVSRQVVVGTTDEGVARFVGTTVELLWPGGGDQPTTPLRFATTGGSDHVVTFRRGGPAGEVLVGWLDGEGAALGPLQSIPHSGLVGRPAVAAGSQGAVVVFPERTAHEDSWRVALASAVRGKVLTTKPLEVPAAATGIEPAAPSMAALDDGRWVLQWIAGPPGNRHVRVQTLDRDLEPIGKVVAVATAGFTAEDGIVHGAGGRAATLIVGKVGKEEQLWVAALDCGTPTSAPPH